MATRTASGAGRILELALVMTLTVSNRDKGPRLRPDIVRVGANQPVVGALFDDVRGPAGDTRDHEKRREHRRRDAAEMVSAGAVKIEIRKQIFLAAHDLLDTLGDRVEAQVAVSC